MTRSRQLGAVLAVLAVLAACTGDGGDDGDVSVPEATDGDSTGTPVEVDGDDPEPVAEPVGPSGRIQLAGFVERNPRSVNLQLRAVEVDANGDVLLDIEAVNRGGAGNASSIAQSGVRVRDDLGTVYEFVPPEDNGRLRFGGDERLTGTLVFRGPIDPEALYLEVGFNQQGDDAVLAADDRPTQYPRFLFVDVPLPGVGLEDEAGDGGGGSLTEASSIEVGITEEAEDVPGYEVTVVEYVEDGQTITFTVEVVNGSSRVVTLAQGNPRLDDGADSQLRWVQPDDVDRRTPEARVDLEPGEEATVQVAFRGVIAPEATELTLRFDEVTVTGIPVPGSDG